MTLLLEAGVQIPVLPRSDETILHGGFSSFLFRTTGRRRMTRFFLAAGFLIISFVVEAPAADCNRNGIDDTDGIGSGRDLGCDDYGNC
jgi:hypothetical protein